MSKSIVRVRRSVAALIVTGLLACSAVLGSPAMAAPAVVPISGTGSTWSKYAIDQWIADVKKFPLTVNYGGGGSTVGRNNFRDGSVDFAVSEIPYGAEPNDPKPSRKFRYLPIVAGGTSFMYNLKVGGRRVTNLRLSGEVITKIFTGGITKWNDPAIAADNPGLRLPARKIIPVVRSDGSGTTAQFVTWMNNQHPGIWRPYCAARIKPSGCAVTSFFPFSGGGNFVGVADSLGVSGYVAQNQGEGAITYVEYSYATKNSFPVAKVLNKAGYYVEPTASNVAVALTQVTISSDLTQKLDRVYNSGDKRSYPLSSYSYMIVPTQVGNGFTERSGYTLSRFGNYFLCEGQRKAMRQGFSPLPVNLVKAGFAQIAAVPGAEKRDPKSSIQSCNNPTFSKDGTNTLARTAPAPPECDRKGGPAQCTTGTGGAPQNTPVSGGGANNVAPGKAAAGQSTKPGAANAGQAAANPAAGGVPAAGAAVIDPDTGQPVGQADTGGAAGGLVAGTPVSLEGQGGWRLAHTMMAIAVVLLVALVIGPPLIMARITRSGAAAGGRR